MQKNHFGPLFVFFSPRSRPKKSRFFRGKSKKCKKWGHKNNYFSTFPEKRQWKNRIARFSDKFQNIDFLWFLGVKRLFRKICFSLYQPAPKMSSKNLKSQFFHTFSTFVEKSEILVIFGLKFEKLGKSVQNVIFGHFSGKTGFWHPKFPKYFTKRPLSKNLTSQFFGTRAP